MATNHKVDEAVFRQLHAKDDLADRYAEIKALRENLRELEELQYVQLRKINEERRRKEILLMRYIYRTRKQILHRIYKIAKEGERNHGD